VTATCVFKLKSFYFKGLVHSKRVSESRQYSYTWISESLWKLSDKTGEKIINTRGFPKPFNMSTGGFQGLFNDGWNNYIFLPFQHTVANIRKNSTDNQANRAKAFELKMVFFRNISTYNCKLLLNITVSPSSTWLEKFVLYILVL
jgi:hypothetical protein